MSVMPFFGWLGHCLPKRTLFAAVLLLVVLPGVFSTMWDWAAPLQVALVRLTRRTQQRLQSDHCDIVVISDRASNVCALSMDVSKAASLATQDEPSLRELRVVRDDFERSTGTCWKN